MGIGLYWFILVTLYVSDSLKESADKNHYFGSRTILDVLYVFDSLKKEQGHKSHSLKNQIVTMFVIHFKRFIRNIRSGI